MHKSITLTLVVAAGVWTQTTSPAAAQRPTGNAYVANIAPRNTVSPYLNLGFNANGISNYPSLVRPLLNDRDALARQEAEAQQNSRLSRRPGAFNAAARQSAEQPNQQRGGQRKFMNYSHYFGGAQ